jgi:hypothetical protein
VREEERKKEWKFVSSTVTFLLGLKESQNNSRTLRGYAEHTLQWPMRAEENKKNK